MPESNKRECKGGGIRLGRRVTSSKELDETIESVIREQLEDLCFTNYSLRKPDWNLHVTGKAKTLTIAFVVDAKNICRFPQITYSRLGIFYETSPTGDIRDTRIPEVQLQGPNPTEKDLAEHRERLQKLAEEFLERIIKSLRYI